MGDSVQNPRWKIKEKFVGKCFPIFTRAAVPRRQPDASEEAKNRLTVFTFASDSRFQESTKIARQHRPCDRRRSSAIVRGLASLKLIVYFENPAISIFLLKMRWECLLSFVLKPIRAIWYLRTKNSFRQKFKVRNGHLKSLPIFFFFWQLSKKIAGA